MYDPQLGQGADSIALGAIARSRVRRIAREQAAQAQQNRDRSPDAASDVQLDSNDQRSSELQFEDCEDAQLMTGAWHTTLRPRTVCGTRMNPAVRTESEEAAQELKPNGIDH